MSYDEFASYFCIYDQKKGRFHGNKKQHLAELRALIKPFTLRRTLADVAPSMPRVSFNFMVVKPDGDADLKTEDESRVDPEDRIAVAMGKVGPLADEIQNNIEGQEYAQTVVFGYHVDPLKALVATLIERGIEAATITGRDSNTKRRNVQEAHTLGILPVLAVQILAGGIAIDLSAASHGYFLELDYVPDNNAQAAARLVNLQTQTPVSFDILTWPGTKDDAVQRRLIQKVRTAVFKT
jgi:SNF2 family DNA or RNA helicase